MKKFFISLAIIFILFLLYASKPDERTCVKGAVRAVWGSQTPDENLYPQYYEQFMNLTSKKVTVKDRILFRQIYYESNAGLKSIGFGACKNVFITAGK